MKGIERFRQAIKNQQDFGNGEFRLAYHDVEEIAGEIGEESGWATCVPAPVDADGEVVPLTTEVMYDDCGRELKVSMFRFSIDPRATRWVAMCSNGNGGNGYVDVSSIHLHRPDSWERLEEDVLTLVTSERLADPEGDVKECICRAKALAERDAKEAGRG